MNTREKAIVLIIHSPSGESIFPEMKEIFGEERAVHISKDLYIKVYSVAESCDAIKVIGYKPTPKNFDLTWLSANDPGFLEFYKENYEQMLIATFKLAFNTGCLKAVYINHLCPFVKKEHIQFAFEKVNNKTVVIGPAPNGRVYLIGITLEHLKVIENFNLWHDNMLDEISEKAKRNKFSVLVMEELPIVRDEDTFRKWIDAKDMEFLSSKDKFSIGAIKNTIIEDKNVVDETHSSQGKKHKKHGEK